MTLRTYLLPALTTGLLTLGGVALGYYAGTTDTPPASVTANPVPEWADPGYADERTQDPTGIPYCDVTDPMYPCIDLTGMGLLDTWGDSGLILIDHYVVDDVHWLAPWDCDERAQDCTLIERDDAPVLYTDDPNVRRIS